MEEILYLYDHYLKEFEATITDVLEENKIILNQTAFYPTSGGQSHDKGTIRRIADNKHFEVLNVYKREGKIIHEVDKVGLKKADKIRGIIDWTRRYKHMRAHTAAHIISEVIHKETRALITGNQIGESKIRIDFSLENFNKEMFKQYINAANKIIAQDLPVTIEFLSHEGALQIPEISKLAIGLPESIQQVRIVKIGNFDVQADGGTHVKSTKEIGKLIFLNAENKGKNNRRVYVQIEP